jgi:hypothetical protein
MAGFVRVKTTADRIPRFNLFFFGNQTQRARALFGIKRRRLNWHKYGIGPRNGADTSLLAVPSRLTNTNWLRAASRSITRTMSDPSPC